MRAIECRTSSPQVAKRLGRPLGLDPGVLLDLAAEVVVADREHPAIRVVDEDDLLGVEQALRDGERADPKACSSGARTHANGIALR